MSENSEKFDVCMSSFNNAREADNPHRRRGIRNMTAYMNDIVSDAMKTALYQKDRTEQNFSLLKYIVQGHLGNIFMNWFDPKFVPKDGAPLDSANALQHIWYAEKELYDYKQSARSCYENGYAYRGVEELVIAKPKLGNPRTWGLKFENRRPDLVLFENVSGDRLSRDAKQAWMIYHLLPKQILRLFPGKEVEVLTKYDQNIKKHGQEFITPKHDMYTSIDLLREGSKLPCIQWYHIEEKKVTTRWLKNGTRIPDTGFTQNTSEDIAAVKAWGFNQGIDISNDMVLTVKDYKPIMYTTIFCPSLGVILEDKEDERQLNGHLPLYAWSFMMKNGVSIGLIDFLWDTQQDFNKRQMAKTKIITKSPVTGKSYFYESMFNGDHNKIQEAIENWTDPSKPMVFPETAPPEAMKMFGILPGTNVPAAVLQDEEFKLRLAEIIGFLPPAMQGRTGNSAESGIAIGRKVVEGTVMQRGESDSIIQHENDKAEDWTILQIDLLGHPVNINREFHAGENTIMVNELVGIRDDGQDVIRNNIAALKDRVKVIITQTKENDYMAQYRRELDVAQLQAMIPNDYNFLVRAIKECSLAMHSDHADDEEKEEVKQACEKQMALVEAVWKNQMKNLGGMPQQQSASPSGQPGMAPQTPTERPLPERIEQ